MKLVGWIREGDRASCNGMVVEGDQRCTSDGRAYAFEGARMVCQKKCVIAEGFARRTLTNGRKAVIHGMKTSGGCPLLSTLNDRDGVGADADHEIPAAFVRDPQGNWIPDHGELKSEQFDEQSRLDARDVDGLPYFIETIDGRTFSGRVSADGLAPRISTSGEGEYTVSWGDEALAKMIPEANHA